MTTQKSEIVRQWEDGLITDAEALIHLLDTTTHRDIVTIVVAMHKRQLEDKTHYYKVCASGDVPLMYARKGKRHGTLMLRLDPDQAAALDECFQHQGYYLKSDMAEHISKIDEENSHD